MTDSITYDHDIERALLGSILIEGKLIEPLSSMVKPEEFDYTKHQKVFKAMLDMHDKGTPIDFYTLGVFLQEKGLLEEIESSYVIYLKESNPVTANYKYYADTVNDYAQKRINIYTLEKTLSDIKEGKLTNQEGSEIVKKRLDSLIAKRGKELKDNSYSFDDGLKEISEMPPALKTGYRDLDSILRIPLNAITLVAGRPRHGKTTFMYNLMLEMSEVYPDKKFYFFTYEEQRKYILAKMINRAVNYNLKKLDDYPEAHTNLEFLKAYISDGRQDKGLIVHIEEGKEKIKSLMDSNRIEIIGESYKVEELTSLIEYLNSIEDIGAIFIDYIQRIPIEARGLDIRNRINYISDEILQTAKKTDLPIILGCQFKRSDNKKPPTLEDLKETGNLEEDANLVLRIYNESAESEEVSSIVGEVDLEITTLKNRDGEVNRKAVLSFDRYTSNIKDSEETIETRKVTERLFK